MRVLHGLFLGLYVAMLVAGYGLYGNDSWSQKLRSSDILSRYVFLPMENWMLGENNSKAREIARVTDIRGRGIVRYRPSNSLIFKRANNPQSFDGKTVIFTGNLSTAVIHIPDLNFDFVVDEDTIVVIDQRLQRSDGETGFELSLLAGKLDLKSENTDRARQPASPSSGRNPSSTKSQRIVIKDFVRMQESVISVSAESVQTEAERPISPFLPGKELSSTPETPYEGRDPTSQLSDSEPAEFLREPASSEVLSFLTVAPPAEVELPQFVPESIPARPLESKNVSRARPRKSGPNLDSVFNKETSYIRDHMSRSPASQASLRGALTSTHGAPNQHFTPSLSFGSSQFMDNYLKDISGPNCSKARELHSNVSKAYRSGDELAKWRRHWAFRLDQSGCFANKQRRPASVSLDELFRRETKFINAGLKRDEISEEIALSIALVKETERPHRSTLSPAVAFGTGEYMRRYLSQGVSRDCNKARELFSNVAQAFRTGDTLDAWKANWSKEIKSARCPP